MSVVQAIHLTQKESQFARDLHSLSWQKSDGTQDSTWPFMCVSIMFTKESLQTLRSGALNKKCNKYKDVMTVLNNFHSSCFNDFAR